jgi:hypothetical protein
VNTEVTPGKNAADGWFVFIYDINLDMLSDVSGIVDIMGMFTNEGVTPYWKYEVSFVKASIIRKDQLIKV